MGNERDQKGRSLVEMPNEYCTIDIETTGLMLSFDEIIEFAGVKVRNGKIVDQFSTLIKPQEPIDDFITQLTGITNKMLKDQPSFEQVAPKILNFVGDHILMGHNVIFDINFLYDNFNICLDQPLRNDFVDLMRLTKRMLHDLPNQKLLTIAEWFAIKPSGHHRALNDCFITIKCFEALRSHIMDHCIDLPKLAAASKSIIHRAKDVTTCCTEFDENHPVYAKSFVFTGTLENMSRTEAMRKVVDLGGHCGDNVTSTTNHLVLGTTDYMKTRNQKSNKHRKAEALLLKGQDIRIIPEEVFYDMIENGSKINKESILDLIEHRVKALKYYDPKSVLLKGNKKDKRYTISLFKVDVIKILESETPSTFIVRDAFLDTNAADVLGPLFSIDQTWSTPVDVMNLSEILTEMIPQLYENCYLSQNYGLFSCCSRYQTCSDANKCIHPNRLIAENCLYKNNLEKGAKFF